MRKKITEFFFNFSLENEIQKKIHFLNKTERVSISKNAVFGKNINFDIQGNVNSFIIKQGFSCRNNCYFLLFDKANLFINERVFLNNNCSINCLGEIYIDSDTIFGEGVKIYDHNHFYNYDLDGILKIEKHKFKIGKVKIGKNCWIGSNVVILNNVEIGDNVIIGANCLVYKSIPSNTIVKHKEDLIIQNR
jgi:acetyltransferase-like isoleucine patch superfamily enzyme